MSEGGGRKFYKQGGDGSYGLLNAKYNQLLALLEASGGGGPTTSGLAVVLANSNNAGGLDITNLNDLGVATINGDTFNIDGVLSAGDTATGKQMLLEATLPSTNFTLYKPDEIQVSDGVTDTVFFQPTQLQYTDNTGTVSATWLDIISGSASSNTLEEVLTANNEADLSIVLKDNLVTPTLTNIITSSAVSITGDGVSGSLGFVVGDVNTVGTATGVLSGTISSATALQLSNFTASTPPFFSPINTTILLNSTTTTASLGFTSGGAFVNAKTMDLTLDGITHTSSSGGNFTINTTDEFNVIADEINATTITGMTVLSSGAGGIANPSLQLVNSNATLNADPTIELYKTGRNLTVGELVGSISMYGLDAVGQKTEFSRIQTKAENVASGNEDGTLSIFNSVNGVLSETFNFNGGQNENNSFRPLDLNGNALRTTSGNLPINATASTGSGHIDITAKTGSVINLDNNISINASASTGTGTITLTPKTSAVVDIAGNATLTGTRQITFGGGTNITDTISQSGLTITNQTASPDVTQSIYQDANCNLVKIETSTNSQYFNTNTPQNHIIRQMDLTSLLDVKKLLLQTNQINMTDFSASPTIEQVDINPTSIQFTSSGSASDSLSIYNNSASGGEITWSNITGTNGLAITSSHSLTLKSTAPTQPLQLDSDVINLVNTNTTTSTAGSNATLATTSAIGDITNYLKLQLNGADIWIPYFTSDPSL